MFQDNRSAIRMEVNSMNSCTVNSSNINIIYLFVEDRVYKKGMEVHQCPTHLMLEDFSEPLQGSMYELFRKIIMGRSSIRIILWVYSFPLKERVENHRIFQVVSESSSAKNGREIYTGAKKSQTDIQNTFAEVSKTKS